MFVTNYFPPLVPFSFPIPLTQLQILTHTIYLAIISSMKNSTVWFNFQRYREVKGICFDFRFLFSVLFFFFAENHTEKSTRSRWERFVLRSGRFCQSEEAHNIKEKPNLSELCGVIRKS